MVFRLFFIKLIYPFWNDKVPQTCGLGRIYWFRCFELKNILYLKIVVKYEQKYYHCFDRCNWWTETWIGSSCIQQNHVNISQRISILLFEVWLLSLIIVVSLCHELTSSDGSGSSHNSKELKYKSHYSNRICGMHNVSWNKRYIYNSNRMS